MPSGPFLPSSTLVTPPLSAEWRHGQGRTPHILSIALEDYFHNFGRVIQRSQWHRFEARVEHSTNRVLDLLDEFDIRATFFALGWIASTLPEVIREVARRGHEIASKGYHQRSLRELSPPELRDDLARAREALERASGQVVVGYRAPGWLERTDLWALEVLTEEGYLYDSSVKPFLLSHRNEPHRRFAHANHFDGKTLWEFPISTIDLAGILIPVGAGNYFRQLPQGLIQQAVALWERQHAAPFNMYFHTWELDPDQPQISAAPLLDRIRLYRNLDKVPAILRQHLSRYRFTGIADYMAMSGTAPATIAHRSTLPLVVRTSAVEVPEIPPAAAADVSRDAIAVTLCVPCFNEEYSLAYLANMLRDVEATLAADYVLHFIFVDDGSVDDTWNCLQRHFAGKPRCTILRHSRNRGITAGILTAVQHARTDIVASIDCDCTYDPHELRQMLPLLAEGVDLVTGSPYHREGNVRNVPTWRLFLSKAASALYRAVLYQKLGTYTSCFRVYRRNAVLNLRIKHCDFLGIAELIGKLDLAGSKVVEFPTTLNMRVLGYSKMKITRTIAGHLVLLAELTFERLTGPPRLRRIPAPTPTAGVEHLP